MEEVSIIAYLKRVFQVLSSTLSRHTKRIILSLPFIALISAIFEVITIAMLIPFINSLINPDMITSNKYILSFSDLLRISNEDIILYVHIIFMVFIIISGLTRIFCNRALIFTNAIIGTELSNAGVATVLSQNYELHTQSNSSEIIVSLTRKIDELLDLTISPVLSFITATITLMVIFSFLVWSSLILFFLLLISILTTYLITIILSSKMLKLYSATQASASVRVMTVLKEMMQGFRHIKLKNIEERYIKNHFNSDNLFRRAQGSIRFYSQSPKYFVETVILLMAVALTANFAGQNSIMGHSALLIMFALGLQKALPYSQIIYNSISLLEGGKKSGLDVLDLLESHKRIKFSQLDFSEESFEFEKIEFLDVSFAYQVNEKHSVENINFIINKGDRICIMGRSGSGKSTFIDLMIGLIYPTKGKIMLNGSDFCDHNLREFQNSVAHVSQDLFLFNSSVAENIAFGVNRSDIDVNRIKRVLKQVALDDYFESLPNGIWTQIGEYGISLSGGQRQRLCIARCLYQESAKILILDEPTSALNLELGNEILDLIYSTNKFQAIVIVTHNPDLQRYCNKLINFDLQNTFNIDECRNG